MEWLAALLAVPQSATLVDWVVADHTLLRALSQRLNQEDALFGEIFELIKKVSEIVLNFDFILRVTVAALAYKLKFILRLDLSIVICIKVLACSS